MGLERFSVVRVPFHSTDRAVTQNRHGLVLSDVSFNTPAGHTVLAMINSQAPHGAGLPIASKLRFRLFTLDNRLVRGELGIQGR